MALLVEVARGVFQRCVETTLEWYLFHFLGGPLHVNSLPWGKQGSQPADHLGKSV